VVNSESASRPEHGGLRALIACPSSPCRLLHPHPGRPPRILSLSISRACCQMGTGASVPPGPRPGPRAGPRAGPRLRLLDIMILRNWRRRRARGIFALLKARGPSAQDADDLSTDITSERPGFLTPSRSLRHDGTQAQAVTAGGGAELTMTYNLKNHVNDSASESLPWL
jgi:hypothetical protein